jgi:hypothetical protein
MIRFKEYLSELFDKPVRGIQEYDPRNGLQYTYYFDVEDRHYYVNVAADILRDKKMYWIVFGFLGDQKSKKVMGQKFVLTQFNTDAVKIFSTVINRVDYYFAQPKHTLDPGDSINFTAASEKRAALYQKFAKHLCDKYDLEMKVFKGDETMFELVKNGKK